MQASPHPVRMLAVAVACLLLLHAGLAAASAGTQGTQHTVAGPAGSCSDLDRARRLLRAARADFLGVRLVRAQHAAAQAVELMRRNHTCLESLRELCEARVFLGVVLLARKARVRAVRQFHAAIAIDPGFRPDRAAVPPEAIVLYDQTRRDLLAGPRGSIRLESVPRASVWVLDGLLRGHTPAVIGDLLPGEHFLTVDRGGTLGWYGIVPVEPGQCTTRHLVLAPVTGRQPYDSLPVVATSAGDAQPTGQGESDSILKSWWFWTLVGAVAVGTAVAVPLLLDRETSLEVTVVRGR